MKTQRSFIKTVKRFFEPVSAYKKMSFIAIMPAFFNSFSVILSVYLIKEITNKLKDGLSLEVKTLIIYFILLVLLRYTILIFFRRKTYAIMWPTFRKYMYKTYIKKFIYLDNNQAEKHWTWKLIALIDKWMHAHVDLLVRFFSDVIWWVTTIILSIIFIWFINITYAFVIIIISIIMFIVIHLIQNKTMEYRRIRRDINIWITRKFVRILMSKFEVLQNDKIDKESEKITNTLNKNIYLNWKIMDYKVIVHIMIYLLIDLSKLFIIFLFWYGLYTTKINFWEFLWLMSIIYLLEQILRNLLNLYIDFIKIFVDVEKLWDFFDNIKNINLQEDKKKFKYKKWDIEIKDLIYSYDKNKKVFNKFNLKIKWWKVTAFVWNSWWWKSTLVKLISSYITPNYWKVIIDKQNLKKVSLKSYYREIWYLTQEPSIFDGTVLDNLTYAIDRKLNKWELKKVLKLSKCDFIDDLPNGLDTEIWEKWIKLSWWQKQRLAIAKIFLKNPKIIILDEPTSALDSFSEEQITKAMHNLFKDRTVIIIAHRLQTVKHADKIYVLEGWKIKEEWTHKELIKQKWIYKKMLDLQSGF